LLGAGLAVAGVATAFGARAGWKWNNYSVGIDFTNRLAYGQVGGVRDSADNVSFIGCKVLGGLDSDQRQLFCSARAPGPGGTTVDASCFVYGPGLNSYGRIFMPANIEIAQTMNSDSYIVFGWDAQGHCNYTLAENYSWHAPRSSERRSRHG